MKMLKFPVGALLAVSMLTTAVMPQFAQATVMRDYDMTQVASQSKIDEVFDRFNYTMAVEWDQQDENFKAQAERDLMQSISDLAASGVSMVEIQKQMENRLLNGKSQTEYRRFLDALKQQNVSPDEAAELTTKFMEKNYAEGTNFNGGGGSSGGWRFAVAVVIIVAVTWAIIRHHDDDDDQEEECEENGNGYNGHNGWPRNNTRGGGGYTGYPGHGNDNCTPVL